MADKEVHVGDKFVIEVREVYWNPLYGHSYFIESIPSLVLHDGDIRCLKPYKEPQKAVPHTCANCKYRGYHSSDFPCNICDKCIEPRDMFEKAD